jgi:NitT/TauT family transport system substrate-binding protein
MLTQPLGRARFLRRLASGALATTAFGGPTIVVPRAARAQAANVIRLGATMADDDTAIYYALKTGMYKKAGLDIEFTVMTSGGATTQAIIAGALDIGKSSLTPLFAAHTKGIPVVIVAPGGIYTDKAPFAVLVQAADTTYKTGKDLDGKTIGVAGLGDVTQLVISMWVDQTGGDSKTLRYVEVPNSAQTVALEQHRIDAALLLNPQLQAALMSGKAKRLSLPMDTIAPQYMLGAWFAMNDWASKHADAVKTFASVTSQSATYTNSHHEATAALMSDATKIPLEVFSKMDRVDNYTTLDPATIQSSIDFAAKYKMITHGFPAREMIFEPGRSA